jgi:cytochrome P450
MTSTEQVTFDPESIEIQTNPYSFYPMLRDHSPLLKSSFLGQPCWILSRRKDISAVLMDPVTYSNKTAPLPSMLFQDPPEHRRLRKMVSNIFTGTAVQAQTGAITVQAEALLQPAVAAGRFDAIVDFASPLTVHMISGLLGMPVEQVERIGKSGQLTDYIVALRLGVTPSVQAQLVMDTMTELMMGPVWNSSYAEGGVMAQLAEQYRRGEITQDELVHTGILLYGAGHTTTTGLIGNGIYMLVERPQDLERIAVDESFVDTFVEEVLRTRPSFQRIQRVTTRPVELYGEMIPAGSVIRLLLGSANRDPDFFQDAETFDPDRERRMHSSFGQGIHTCLGSWLARLEATIAIKAVARHVARITLDTDRPTIPLMGGTFNEFGFKQLPVILEPRGVG